MPKETDRSTVLQDTLADHLLKTLTTGEQVIVTDKDTGEKHEVRVEPQAATLRVILDYIKSFPPQTMPTAESATGVLSKYKDALPQFKAPRPN